MPLYLMPTEPSSGELHLTNARYVQGSYFVVKDLTELNEFYVAGSPEVKIDEEDGTRTVEWKTNGTIVKGSLCYCQDNNTFYQYNGAAWVTFNFGGGGGGDGGGGSTPVEPPEDPITYLRFSSISNDEYAVFGVKDPDDTEGLKTQDVFENLVIPSSYEGKPVTYIAGGAFACCSKLKSVKIPNSIKEIGERAFLNCTSLQGVEIPDSVKKIGYDIVLDDGRIGFGGEVFEGCTSLEWVTIPKSVEIMGYDIFAGCTFDKLTIYCETPTEPPGNKWCNTEGLYWNPLGCRVLYNNRVEQIKDRTTVTHNGLTYSSSKGLLVKFNQDKTACSIIDVGSCTDTDVVIPSTYGGLPISSIGSRAFQNCHSIASVLIGNNITDISEYAFYNCTNLTTVELPEGFRTLAYTGSGAAFGNCTKLESVTIPESVKYVGKNIFIGCVNATIYCAAETKPPLWNANWNPSNCEVVWSAPVGGITLDTISQLRIRCKNLETRCSNLETKLNTAINRLWENEKFIYELLFAIAVYEDVSDDVKVWMTKYEDVANIHAPDGTLYDIGKYASLGDAEKTELYTKYIDP